VDTQRGESAPAQARRRGDGPARARLTRDDTGWEVQLAQLRKYRRRHGDCNVPRSWAEDPPLGTWVHNQRSYKKALGRGEPSERMTALRAGGEAGRARLHLGAVTCGGQQATQRRSSRRRGLRSAAGQAQGKDSGKLLVP
jgi:hypothetical protein